MEQSGQKSYRQTKKGYELAQQEHLRVIGELQAEKSQLINAAQNGQLSSSAQQRIDDIDTMIKNRNMEIFKAQQELDNNTFPDGTRDGE